MAQIIVYYHYPCGIEVLDGCLWVFVMEHVQDMFHSGIGGVGGGGEPEQSADAGLVCIHGTQRDVQASAEEPVRGGVGIHVHHRRVHGDLLCDSLQEYCSNS